MSNKQFMFILIGLLAALAVFTSLSTYVEQKQAVKERKPDASVYNRKMSGYRGWYKTLEIAKIPAEVWRHDFTKLRFIDKPSTMVIIQPKPLVPSQSGYKKPVNYETVEQLIRWSAEKGNTVVFLDDFESSSSYHLLKLLRSGDIWKKNQDADLRIAYDLQFAKNASGRLRRYVTQELVTHSPTRIEIDPIQVKKRRKKTTKKPDKKSQKKSQKNSKKPEDDEDAEEKELPVPFTRVTLLTDQNGDPILEKHYIGKGAIIIGTVPDLASNRFLMNEDNDNLQFFTNMLVSEGKPLYVNEFVHGYLSDPNLFSYYLKTPIANMLYQLIFLFFLVLWLSFKPWRPTHHPMSVEEDVNLKEFVRSMSGIYLKANAAPLAIGPQLVNIEQTIRRRYRIDISKGDPKEQEKLENLLANLSPDYSNKQIFMQSLHQARQIINQRLKMPPDALVKLVQILTLIQERLDHGHRK